MSRTLIFKQETRKTRRHSYGYRTFISFLTTLSHPCLLYIVAGVLMESSDTYLIRPSHQRKFRPAVVKECVREIVRERLSGVEYNPEEVTELSRSLAECIKDKVKNAGFDRYKLVVQVVIGEQRGQGVKMSSRCFWDADTDSYAEDIFMNDSLFCVVAVFGSYYY